MTTGLQQPVSDTPLFAAVNNKVAPASTLQEQFDTWLHTPQGRQVSNLFIRLAIGCNRRGVRVGARMLGERIRWHYFVRRVPGDEYKVNDHLWPYMARFAMQRVPELAGYFTTRAVCGELVV